MTGGRDAHDLRELQALNRDLVALLALPAMWQATAGGGPVAIIEVLLDVLLSMLRLDWVFARIGDPAVDIARADRRPDSSASAVAIRDELAAALAVRPLALPAEIDNPCGAGRVRLASVPVATHGTVIIAASSRPTFPTDRDLLILRVAMNQTSIGLEAARLMAAERHRSVQLTKLAQASLVINSLRSLESVMAEITERARDIVGSHMAVTSLPNGPDFEDVVHTTSLSEKYAPWRSYATKPTGAGIYRLVCETNRSLRLTQSQLERHPSWRGFGSEVDRHPPLNGLLAVPIVASDGTNMGLIQLSDKHSGAFDEADERMLVQLAQMAGVAVENVRLTEDLRQSQQAALEAGRRKDEFLALLGHELRNPLAPIVTALELMKMRGDVGGERERNVIERQVRHVARLVDDLLDISRVTRGQLELRRAPLELGSAIAKAIDMAQPLFEAHSHHVDIDVPASGLVVVGDAVRLAQVFANLLTNAAKYTPPRGRIHVRARISGSQVVVTVTDNGRGIPAELLPRLFDLFVQGERTLDRREGGLGLGLAIVRTLLSLHGGSVSVRSDGLGQGSEFTVTLPVATSSAGGVVADAETAVAAQSDGPRVLVVDDNADAREMLASALEVLGCTVYRAGDAPRALAIASTTAIDVAVLDIGLPVMDGYELARQLRALGRPALRLFAVSGYGQAADREKAVHAGFEQHFVKPVALNALQAAITRGPS